MATSDHLVTRRQFSKIGALGATGLAFPSPAGAEPSATEGLRSELLMELELEIAARQSLGPRQIIPITGGRFDGPRLKGTALAGGGDWLIRRPDGVIEVNVRCTLQATDEQLIYMWYRGVVYATPSGEQYVRTTPVFETASDTYGWLNRTIAVGVGRQVPGKAAYRIYEIL